MTNELTPREADALVRERDAQLVDVRETFEVEAGRIAGSRHVRFEELPAEAGNLDRGRPIVFYCRTGSRSAMAAQAFASSGYDARNLDGGLQAWVADGLPIEPEDGRIA